MEEYNITRVIIGQSESDPLRVSYFEFRWIITNQSLVNNTSTISWELRITAEGGASYDSAELEPYKVTVNGAVYEGTANLKTSTNRSHKIVSGEEVVQHNPDGTGSFDFSFSVELNGWIMAERNPIRRGSGVGILDSIPQKLILTSAPDMTDVDNPTITYEVPLGWENFYSIQACISFTSDDAAEIPYRDITDPASGIYTFYITSAEHLTLLSRLTPNTTSIPIKFYIRTIVKEGDEPQLSAVTRTLTYVNYEPTLNPRVLATDGLTKTLTGDTSGGTLIKNHSTVSVEARAAATKGTLTLQKVTHGNETIESASSSSLTGELSPVTSNTFYFSATNSYGFTTRKAVLFSADNGKFIEYFKPTCSIKSANLSPDGNLTFTIVGKYFDDSFGASENTFELDYSLQESGGDIVWYRTGYVEPTVDGRGNYEFTYTVTGLDYSKSYELQVYVIDAITNSSTSSKVLAATTVFDWGKNDFRHNTDVVFTNQKSIIGTKADGSTFRAIETCNGSDNIAMNWDGYDSNSVEVGIYGKKVEVLTKEGFFIENRAYGEQRILWSDTANGAWLADGTSDIYLSEAISTQPNGIVLVFSLNRDGSTVADASFQSFFISKKEVELFPGKPHSFFLLINSGFSVVGAKYIYIYNNYLSGDANNGINSSNNGFTYKNNNFVLRRVIGV